MGDYDRDKDPPRKPDLLRDPIPETERITEVHTERRSGGSGMVIAIILLIAILALLFFLFGGNLNRAADEVNVNIETPAINIPDINVQIPDVDVKMPDVDVDAKDGDTVANKTG